MKKWAMDGDSDTGKMRIEDKIKSKENQEEIIKIGTWNIRSLNGKETELIQEFEKAKLNILAIVETKKKGKGIIEMENGHILLYSGVELENRAKAGVGCIINKEYVKYIDKWEFVSETILTVEMKLEDQTKTIIVVTYGPNEDETRGEKEEFWEKLSEVVEDINGRIILIGDLNGRVAKRMQGDSDVIGPFGERVRNNNGNRLIHFCEENNLMIMNTFFKHKEIHSYTREVKSRNEKSIIDYVLINRSNKKEILDVRAKRGPEINSDHYLVTTKLKIKINKNQNMKTKRKIQKSKKVIKNYKLLEEVTAKKYRDTMEIQARSIINTIEEENIEELWQQIKNSIITTAENICGTTIIDRNRKQTKWWTEEIKKEVKIKKNLWQRYLQRKTEESRQKYKEQRTKVKELVKQSKNVSWEEFGQKMEEDAKANQKLFYKTIKNLRKNKQYEIKQVKGKNNEIITDDQEIMQRWKEYFNELLNNHQYRQEDREEEIEFTEHYERLEPITIEEIEESIKKLKRGKSAGHDRISPEMIINLGKYGKELLLKIFNEAWEKAIVPDDWKIGVLIPIHKKGDTRDCTNYRGITLLSTISKVYEKILEEKLRTLVEDQLDEAQSGFRKGHSVQDHVFTIKQLIEKSRTKEVYMAFLDLQKAFDSVKQTTVWDSLIQRNVPKRLINTIKSLFANNKGYVRKNNLESQSFTIKDGLRQGGVLSPLLFIIVMDDIIKATKRESKKVRMGYYRLNPVELSECAFADDLMICAPTERDLINNTKLWERELQKRNLKVNVEKSKVVYIGEENKQINITIEGKKMEQVEMIKYLGVTIHREGTDEAEINERISGASKLYHALSSSFIGKKEISRKTKMTVYKTIYRPILTYGSESWVLTNRTKSRIQAMEMKYLRRVKGITRKDRIRNEVVREELGIESIDETIENNKLKWFGHMTRMTNKRPVKIIWEARSNNKRKRGRPRKTWNQGIAKILERRGKTWDQARTMAKNKKAWAKFVHEKKK